MDTLASTEFRKRFARLEDPTFVTVNGHLIGIWQPMAASTSMQLDAITEAGVRETLKKMRAPATTAQVRRDDLLRKINRSKG
jgi:hypothetical protein